MRLLPLRVWRFHLHHFCRDFVALAACQMPVSAALVAGGWWGMGQWDVGVQHHEWQSTLDVGLGHCGVTGKAPGEIIGVRCV